MRQVHLAFLWHFHQPCYRDPATGSVGPGGEPTRGSSRYVLPWVRLHAVRSYLDMPFALEPFERMRANFNVVPSLVEQLEDYAAGARDLVWDLTERPAVELTPVERQYILKHFFSINWTHGIDALPRYAQLIDQRGRDLRRVDLAEVAESFTVQEMTDLQVLFNLAWTGFAARARHPELGELLQKGRGYSESDKRVVLELHRQLLRGVVAGMRQACERGQVELSATPAYHPILPLLCDTEVAKRAMPGAMLPEHPFVHPEDARAQVLLALDAHERTFGRRPTGMWPAEGSVSPEVAQLFADSGVEWIASDEGVLWNSTVDFGAVSGRDRLYRAYRAHGVSIAFRDRELSERIGFLYSKSPPEEAARDFIDRLRQIAQEPGSGHRDPLLVSVFLDGENPWENFAGSGEPFLRALYTALEGCDFVRTVKLTDHLHEHVPSAQIRRLHTGSWIDADFHIWINEPTKNQAWRLLGRARERLSRAEADPGSSIGPDSATPAEALARARHHLHIAEGSDWFWWYGEPFKSENEAEFDALFRGNLAAVYRALGDEPPHALEQPIVRGAPVKPVYEPTRFIHPRLNGRRESYFEWRGAGLLRLEPAAGTMAQSAVFAALYYGFDLEQLYLRFDPAPVTADGRGRGQKLDLSDAEMRRRFAGLVLRISLHGDSDYRVEIRLDDPTAYRLYAIDSDLTLNLVCETSGQAAFVRVLELGIPFGKLGLHPEMTLSFSAKLLDGKLEVERYPRSGHVTVVVPDEDFEARHWSV